MIQVRLYNNITIGMHRLFICHLNLLHIGKHKVNQLYAHTVIAISILAQGNGNQTMNGGGIS